MDSIIEQKIANRERLTHEELKHKLVEKRGTKFYCKECGYASFEFSKMRRHAEGRSWNYCSLSKKDSLFQIA